MPEPEPKPIDEVLSSLKDLVRDVKTIKNDVAVIKSRLHELNRIRIQKEKEQENISNGWGVGWW